MHENWNTYSFPEANKTQDDNREVVPGESFYHVTQKNIG